MDFYRQLILDHYKHPRNFGHLDKPDVVAQEGNVTCGDRIIMEIKVKSHLLDKTHGGQVKVKIVEDVRFSGEGCAISFAVASLLTEKIKGLSVPVILKLRMADILALLKTNLTPSRTKCAVLPLEVAQKALQSK